ncbi:MAG: site-2 protease family protein [Acidimicrobiia bacterium]|nr:site-2 protease family protein [Acidimicrobiia bacterium]
MNEQSADAVGGRRSGRISLGRWLGIEITIDPSWLVIAFLIGWSFYLLFVQRFPDLSGGSAVILGTGTAALFFLSVLIHELSHSVMARRLGMPVEGITLFIFGGVTRTGEEADTAGEEFAVAVVGPLSSFALAGVFWALVNLTGSLFPAEIRFGLGHLGWLNLALGAFNLLPGFPLDGGRVLRSAVWRATGSLERATRIATAGGRLVGSTLIAIGLAIVLFAGDLGGLWYAAIGWFLNQAAAAQGQRAAVRRAFQGMVAGDVMSPRLVTIDENTTLDDAVDGYFLRYDHNAFPVTDAEGDTMGMLSLRAVRQIPREEWPVRQAWAVMTRLGDLTSVDIDTPMDDALNQLTETDEQRVLVTSEGRVVGIITPRDVARWVQRSEELGLAGED